MKSKFEAGSACCSDCSGSQAHNPFRASTGYLSTRGCVWYPGVLRTVFPGAIQSYMSMWLPRRGLTNMLDLSIHHKGAKPKCFLGWQFNAKLQTVTTDSYFTRDFIQQTLPIFPWAQKKSCIKLDMSCRVSFIEGTYGRKAATEAILST